MKTFINVIKIVIIALVLSIGTPTTLLNQNIVLAADTTSQVKINYDKAVISKDDKLKLKLTGTASKITWKTSDKEVATVSKKGVITGKSNGTVTITAEFNKQTITCQITVTYAMTAKPYEHKDHDSADYMTSDTLTRLDMKSTFDDFVSAGYPINGIYATAYSDKPIYIEGFDSNGKSLGVAKNNGIFYFTYANAVSLKIMNPEMVRYTIDFLPVNPKIISSTGTYNYNDFTWYKMKDGNIQAHVIFAMPNTYLEFIEDTEQASVSAKSALCMLSMTPHDTGTEFDPDMMGAWRSGYFVAKTAEEAGNLENLKVHIGQYQTYFDDPDIFTYGKEGLTFPEGYKSLMFSYRDLVKKITSEKYLPNQTGWDKPLRIRYTYNFRSAAGKDYLVMYESLLTTESSPETYFHEMTHYYHLESMDYGCQISAWTEGTAMAVEEDGLKELGLDTTTAMIPVKYMNKISEDNQKNFENYFLNVGYGNDECYAVGYNFIRFIQDKYGSDVVYKINQNIINCVPKPVDGNISPNYRSTELDKLMIQAIKDATSEDVFERFVNEYAKMHMSSN